MENPLVIGIMDILEDKLREFGIQIPDDDREDSRDPIVGYHYAELHDRIYEYLEEAGAFKSPDLIQEPFHIGPEDIVYPHDFGNGYKIQRKFANRLEDGGYGDIYDFRSDVLKEHPGSEVLIGFCVIADASGLIPRGCHDWNETIPAAIQDYVDHVAPILEQEGDIELNHTVVDAAGTPIRETLFTVKSGWLQDYFGLDNAAQLEAFLTNSDDWDPSQVFSDAQREATVSGLVIGEITSFPQASRDDHVHRNAEMEMYIDLFHRAQDFKKEMGLSCMNPAQVMLDLNQEFQASPEELYTLASKLIDGIYMTDDPFLYGERIAAITTIVEDGFSGHIALDDLDPDSAVDFLLHCSAEEFISIVDLVAKENQSFYTAEWTEGSVHDELMEQVNESIAAFLELKAPLSDQLQAASRRSEKPHPISDPSKGRLK